MPSAPTPTYYRTSLYRIIQNCQGEEKKEASRFGPFAKSTYLCTVLEEKAPNTPLLTDKRLLTSHTSKRRDGRVVDYTGLENRRAERHRGFESLSLR